MNGPIEESDIFRLIGEHGLRQLVAAFYRRVPSDPVLGPMYPANDLPAAEQRLGGFLIQRFGGPDTYSQHRGHPRLRMRHAPFAIGSAARDHWLALMGAAADEVAFDSGVRAILESYFRSTAEAMMNQIDGGRPL
jgi:hemoglobin